MLLHSMFLACYRILISWLHTFPANLIYSGPPCALWPLCRAWGVSNLGSDGLNDRSSLGMVELSVHRRKSRYFPRIPHTVVLCTIILVRKLLLIKKTFLLRDSKCAVLWGIGEEEVDNLHHLVAKVGDEEQVRSFYLHLKLTASPLKGHFLIEHIHLESRTDIPRLSYFHFSPQITPSFSLQLNLFFWCLGSGHQVHMPPENICLCMLTRSLLTGTIHGGSSHALRKSRAFS